MLINHFASPTMENAFYRFSRKKNISRYRKMDKWPLLTPLFVIQDLKCVMLQSLYLLKLYSCQWTKCQQVTNFLALISKYRNTFAILSLRGKELILRLLVAVLGSD